MRPTYLVLDEPTAMLDPAGRRAVLDLMDGLAHDDGHGVVHVSHDAAGIARADRVLVLEGGAAAFFGAPAELLSDQALLRRGGIELPGIGRLAEAIRRLGTPIPIDAMDAESVVGALWR
jgi:energy-coupling factor transport system ATP-binding protein